MKKQLTKSSFKANTFTLCIIKQQLTFETLEFLPDVCLYMCLLVCVYIYVCVDIHIYIYIYMADVV